MDLEYDVFERFPDGSVEWRGFVVGVDAAQARLQVLAKQSKNELFAIHTPTQKIAARVNEKNGNN